MSDSPNLRLAPLIVHPLPAAPSFTGRIPELDQMRQFWQQKSGVLSLIGLGGAGKTALTRRFIDQVLSDDLPNGLFVWSFYDEPDANSFLQAAYQYFTGGRTADAKGAGWFHLLKDALSTSGRNVLVLDGLERVQRQQTDAGGIYGELEDPLLRGFLTRIAAGMGETQAFITSRFPVSDLEKWRGRGYTLIDVNPLEGQSGRALLRAHGIEAEDDLLDRLMAQYGGHALTLDLLGGAITRFFGGNQQHLIEFMSLSGTGDTPQAERLREVLRIYEQRLPAPELALLCRLCIFRFGVDADALDSIFLGPGKEGIAGAMAGITRTQLESDLEDLVTRHLTSVDSRGRYTMHPAVRDFFYGLFNQPEVLHNAVREHLATLSERPGLGPTGDKATLDLLEELIYHAIHAGNLRQAEEIYRHRMGGNDFLNAELGEYVRTHRILQAFPECPDKSAMYHCLRAFGRFEEALHWRPNNRYIELIQGQLQPLCTDSADVTRRMACFLAGQVVHIPDRSSDSPIPAAMLHLYKGNLEEARNLAEAEIGRSLYKDDIARNRLMLAECARREGRISRAAQELEPASQWILNSGSQEHLALLHLIRGRMGIDERNFAAARAALEEGLHTAQESGFKVVEADTLIELGRLAAEEGNWESAEGRAREAVECARSVSPSLAWSEATALQLLGEILRRLKREDEARIMFEESLALRRRIGDTSTAWTEKAIRQLTPAGYR